MKTKGLSRPGALQIVFSLVLSIAVFFCGYYIFDTTHVSQTTQYPVREWGMLFVPGLLIILGWQGAIGFHKYAAHKGLEKDIIKSLSRIGIFGLYLMLGKPEKVNFNLESETSEAQRAQPISTANSVLSVAKQIKLTILMLCALALGSFVMPWTLWLSNYDQASDDFKNGFCNTLRINYAETALLLYPNSEDLAKVLTLKSKIYKTWADELTVKLPNWTKKEQVQRKAEIDQLYKTGAQAEVDGERLSHEHWGTSSAVCFSAIGASGLLLLALALFVCYSKQDD